MGFISEIKKLFFVKKSVAKSATALSGELIKEKSSKILSEGKEVVGQISNDFVEKTSGLRDAILDTGENLIDKTNSFAKKAQSSLSESEHLNKAADFTEKLGEKVIKKTSELGSDLLDTGKILEEKLGEASQNVGEGFNDLKDELVEKAKNLSKQMEEKFHSTYDKAKAFEEAEALKPTKEFADDTIDTSKSLLDDTDDFFSKAEKFADGNYKNETPSDEPKLDTSTKIEKAANKAAGFEDLDGDGNELIDDAIIIE